MRIRNAAGIGPLILFGTIILASFKPSAARPEGSTKSVFSSRPRGPEVGEEYNPALVQRRGNSKSVKTSEKDSAPPFPRSGPWARESDMIQAFGMPKMVLENDGDIERVNLDRVSALDGKVDKVNIGRNEATSKRIKNEEGLTEDLAAQEAKVFRPLFVYRQQTADRYRLNRRRNPIYGAYQYGRNRPRNFAHSY